MTRGLYAVVLGLAAGAGAVAADAADQRPARLLCVTVTTGFRHASIPAAEAALEEIGRESNLFHLEHVRQPPDRPPQPKPPKRGERTTDEEWQRQQADFRAAQEAFGQADAPWQEELRDRIARAFAPETLAAFDGVIFASTTGDLPIPDLEAFLAWIRSGRAFVGFHAATDTLRKSDAYVAMVGGAFAGHPWLAEGEHAFVVNEPGHRLVAMFPERFRHRDEIYQYDGRSVPENVRVLVSLDMAGSRPQEPWHVPVSWVRDYGKGRVFSTNFGHNEATWREPMFRKHAAEGIAWAVGRCDAPAEPNPDVQAAEYMRSVIAAAAAATGADHDALRAKADAKIAADPAWALGLRPKLLELRGRKPADRTAVYAEVMEEIRR
jgi:type 1 glutamine amidotransferase